jgi:hypothetical protein
MARIKPNKHVFGLQKVRGQTHIDSRPDATTARESVHRINHPRTKQTEEPITGETEPALQVVATDKPVVAHADPAGHGAQVEYPVAGENFPTLHGVATDKPVTPHAVPAGHVAHAE